MSVSSPESSKRMLGRTGRWLDPVATPEAVFPVDIDLWVCPLTSREDTADILPYLVMGKHRGIKVRGRGAEMDIIFNLLD